MMQWYPMRVTYNRELKVKQRLDMLGIENFVPMHYEIILYRGDRKRMLVPAIHNLIFVRSVREQLTRLKYNDQELEPLRYMMTHPVERETKSEIITVPDHEMDNFIRVCRAVDDERIRFLRYEAYLDKPGQRVRIIDGNFAGVEGVIKRIKKNKQVVVMIPGIAAVTLNSLPRSFLEEI